MSNYNWVEIIEKLQKVFEEDTVDFNEETTYSLLRRYNTRLPFSFNRCIKIYKEENGLTFVERRVVLREIFMNLNDEKRLDLINHMLYYFHKRRLNRKKLNDLEEYLDSHR